MSRAEKRYNWIEDIIAWGHGKYQREELKRLNMPALEEIHSKVCFDRLLEINSIKK